MATDEKVLQEAIKSTIQALSWFEDGEVVINDWEIMNGPGMHFFIIENSDTFEIRQVTVTQTNRYMVRGWLLVEKASRSWKEAYDEFRDIRQAIGNAFVGSARTAGGLPGVQINAILNIGEKGFIYPQDVDPELQPDALPQFVTQMIGFDIEEF